MSCIDEILFLCISFDKYCASCVSFISISKYHVSFSIGVILLMRVRYSDLISAAYTKGRGVLTVATGLACD